MFHIFRWRRVRQREDPNSTDLSAESENKDDHTRSRRFQVYRARPSLERLLHFGRYRSASRTRPHQVGFEIKKIVFLLTQVKTRISNINR